MLRIVVQQNTAAVLGAYFAGGTGDYYAEGLDVTGEWGGQGALRLGLSGAVGRDVFEALCRNEFPGTGKPLTPRTNTARRVGYDFTFNCPKSLSVLYGLTRAPELLAAFQAAVRETMAELEALAETRVRRDGERSERPTGNFVRADFVHTTARPVDGVPDPHLHCHSFVFNATWDPVENRWKAVDLAEVKRNAPYFEAGFHARLALKLRDEGFDIAPTANGWEIAGIPEPVVRSFSRRTQRIEAVADSLGVLDPKVKDALGAKTRDRKRTNLSADALRLLWWGRLTFDDRNAVRAVSGREVPVPPDSPDAAREAVGYAAAHCFERQSVVPVNVLLATALRRGVGQVSVEDARRELASSGLLLRERDGRALATSAEVFREERRMLAFARDGRGACARLGRPDWRPSRDWLSAEQLAVVRHILQSADRVILVRGAAGTGKTSLMREAVAGIEAGGRRVVTLAPSADASRGVLRSEGFADADTVARFLLDERFQEEARGQVLWVDEAGLLGSRMVANLFAAAARLGARVVLSGDRGQHSSVERGAVLRLLESEAGLPVAEVTEVRRQSGMYKDAAQLLGGGRTLAAFDVLDDMGWVREVTSAEQEQTIASAVVRSAAEKKSVLVISPTHAEGRLVTAAIRDELRRFGHLGPDDRTFLRLDGKGWTAAERGNPLRYEVGDVVEFHQNAPGFVKGSRYTVTTVGRASVVVRDRDGTDRILPLGLACRFEVYAVRELVLAEGDRVRVTKNGRSGGTRFDNGTLFTVTGFTKGGDIVVGPGRVLSRDYGHLAHGYAVTSHAAQGKTVDRVFLAQSSESFPASSRAQFYVSATRAREQLLVFTDDKDGLRRAIQRDDPRTTATELLRTGAAHPAWAAGLMRHARRVGRIVGQSPGQRATLPHTLPREGAR